MLDLQFYSGFCFHLNDTKITKCGEHNWFYYRTLNSAQDCLCTETDPEKCLLSLGKLYDCVLIGTTRRWKHHVSVGTCQSNDMQLLHHCGPTIYSPSDGTLSCKHISDVLFHNESRSQVDSRILVRMVCIATDSSFTQMLHLHNEKKKIFPRFQRKIDFPRKSDCRQASRHWSRNLSWLGANFEWSCTVAYSCIVYTLQWLRHCYWCWARIQ